MGACPVRAVSADHVFFTHGHIDHVGAVVTHANLRRLSGLSGATYHADEALAASVGDLLRISEVMCGGPLPHTVRAFQAGGTAPPTARRACSTTRPLTPGRQARSGLAGLSQLTSHLAATWSRLRCRRSTACRATPWRSGD